MAELPTSTLFIYQSGIELLYTLCGWTACAAADHTTIDINDWHDPSKRTGDKGFFATVNISEAEVRGVDSYPMLPTKLDNVVARDAV
jgi:hypothetical protein